jgi:hypothetical protein
LFAVRSAGAFLGLEKLCEGGVYIIAEILEEGEVVIVCIVVLKLFLGDGMI